MQGSLTVEHFTALLGTTFHCQIDTDHEVDFVLFEAAPSRFAMPGATRKPFSLVFHGPKEIPLPQRIYPLRHETLGLVEIFLVPIGPDSVGPRYQAVFN